MKKTAARRKLTLDRQAVAVLSARALRDASGAAPRQFPESWFECGFTLRCD